MTLKEFQLALLTAEEPIAFGRGMFNLQHYRFSRSLPLLDRWRVDITEPNRGFTLSRRGGDPAILIELLMQDFEDRGMV